MGLSEGGVAVACRPLVWLSWLVLGFLHGCRADESLRDCAHGGPVRYDHVVVAYGCYLGTGQQPSCACTWPSMAADCVESYAAILLLYCSARQVQVSCMLQPA